MKITKCQSCGCTPEIAIQTEVHHHPAKTCAKTAWVCPRCFLSLFYFFDPKTDQIDRKMLLSACKLDPPEPLKKGKA